MTYQFDAEIASLYGVDEAIMIANLLFWIRKNEANNRHFYDGRYWTYNSIEAFTKLFPFWTARQIRRVLKSLEDKEVIVTGNYNASAYDRTTWYAFGDSFLQKCQIHFTKPSNGSYETVNSIIDSNIIDINTNTDIKPDNNTNIPAGSGFSSSKRRKTSENLCLFENSRFFDFEVFCAEFEAPEYEMVDIGYYYHAVADWSSQKGKKMKDWIATARNFIRGDIEKGKLHRLNGGLSEDAIRYLQSMAD